MTPPPSAGGSATAGRLGRAGHVAPRIPRRTSGPARRPRAAAVPPPTRGPRQAPPVVQTLRRLPDARFLDRLLRGRAWIALIAVALLGIVFMQVSLLKLNAGISRAVGESDVLERQNSELRAAISGLDAEARIEETAALTGLHMPAAGDVRYLDARAVDPARAAASITPPDRERAATIRQRIDAGAPGTASTTATSTATTAPTSTTAPSSTTTTPPATTTSTSTSTPTTTTAPSTTSGATAAPTTSSTPAPAAPTATTAAATTAGATAAPEGQP